MEEKILAVKIIQMLTVKLLTKKKPICGADTTLPVSLWTKTETVSATGTALPAPSWMKTETVSAIDAALPALSWTKTETVSATGTALPAPSWMRMGTAFATDRVPALNPDKDIITVTRPTAATARDTVTDNPGTLTMRSPEEIDRAMKLYADTVRRVCMIYLKNYADTEDIFQTVFLKYLQNTQVFENPEHEKAWFIRVSINACKDLKKNFFRSRTVSLDTLVSQPAVQSSDTSEVLEAVLSLPQKYRNVIYLHYYEGYTAPQISRLLGKKVNTIYTLLTRARLLLKEKLGGEDYE